MADNAGLNPYMINPPSESLSWSEDMETPPAPDPDAGKVPLKACAECEHHWDTGDGMNGKRLHMCRRLETRVSVITGRRLWDPNAAIGCVIERSTQGPDHCGMEGKFWSSEGRMFFQRMVRPEDIYCGWEYEGEE